VKTNTDIKTMKIKIYCDSGANIHSCRSEIVTPEDLGTTEEEWKSMSDEEKEELVKPIAFDRLDWGWEDVG